MVDENQCKPGRHGSVPAHIKSGRRHHPPEAFKATPDRFACYIELKTYDEMQILGEM